MNTCANALDRHVEGGRADQPALIYDSPVTDTKAAFTYRELRDAVARFAGALAAPGRRAGRPRDRLHADGSRGARSRCSRARGSAPSTRSSSAASRRTSSRRGSRTRSRRSSCRASCGIEPGRIVAYKPLLDAAIAAGRVEARALHRAPAADARGRARSAARPRVARRARGRRAGRLRPARGDGPAVHHLHVRDDRPAEGDRPRQRRPRGRARVVDEERLRHRPGRGVLGGVGHRLDRRALVHRLRAAAARLHDRPLRGQAGRHARRGRVLARLRRARRQHALHRADGVPRDPPAGPGRRAHRPLRPLEAPRALPRGRALRPRDAAAGPRRSSACR